MKYKFTHQTVGLSAAISVLFTVKGNIRQQFSTSLDVFDVISSKNDLGLDQKDSVFCLNHLKKIVWDQKYASSTHLFSYE